MGNQKIKIYSEKEKQEFDEYVKCTDNGIMQEADLVCEETGIVMHLTYESDMNTDTPCYNLKYMNGDLLATSVDIDDIFKYFYSMCKVSLEEIEKAQQPIKEINLSKYPRVFNVDTPFWEDLYNYYNNPTKMNKAEFNLICSKRDISLWTKMGMKPHRGWKVSDAKTYFNIKGTKESLLVDFMEVWEEYQEMKKELSEAVSKGFQIQLTA